MKHVVVILPSDKAQHRQILSGVLEGGHTFGPWHFHLELGDRSGRIVGPSRAGSCDGIIAMVDAPEKARELLDRRLPAVLINPPAEGPDKPDEKPPRHAAFVRRDQRDVGRTAAEYFLDRGHTSFAFVGTATRTEWSEQRHEGFRSRLEASGHTCSSFLSPEGGRSVTTDAQELGRWLRTLRPGTALYTPDDERALQVLSLCADANIAVPDTLSVLGTDNDALLCESSTPPLSSIDLKDDACGKLCARLLSRLMAHRRVEPVLSLTHPPVVERQSTNVSLIADPILAKALALVRRNLQHPYTVHELANTIGVSRRTLELKARHVLGTTLKAEIDGIRLNEAVRALSNSSLSVQEVAIRYGFCSASHLSRRLRAAFGYGTTVFRYQDPSEA